jgi:citrate synthase
MATGFQAGLREVAAATSALCTVDGEAGELRFRGYDIGDLTSRASYEEVTALLWDGELPGRSALEAFTCRLARDRASPEQVLAALSSFPPAAHPVEALRAALSVHAPRRPPASPSVR